MSHARLSRLAVISVALSLCVAGCAVAPAGQVPTVSDAPSTSTSASSTATSASPTPTPTPPPTRTATIVMNGDLLTAEDPPQKQPMTADESEQSTLVLPGTHPFPSDELRRSWWLGSVKLFD